jgi:hypothetical protein
MPKKRAPSASLVQLLRRAGEVLTGTRRHLAEELLARADKIEKIKREADEHCSALHRLGCARTVLAEIDEP